MYVQRFSTELPRSMFFRGCFEIAFAGVPSSVATAARLASGSSENITSATVVSRS